MLIILSPFLFYPLFFLNDLFSAKCAKNQVKYAENLLQTTFAYKVSLEEKLYLVFISFIDIFLIRLLTLLPSSLTSALAGVLFYSTITMVFFFNLIAIEAK